MCLGHVYIVLEHVGSARLTFDDDFVLYELCDLVIESRASNIPMDKGNNICYPKVRPIKIFIEYVGANMGIQVPLLVIDQRGVSVMST